MKEYLNKLLDELEIQSTLEETGTKDILSGMESFRNLFDYLGDHEDQMPQALERISAGLSRLDVYRGCCISFFCGYLIERVGLGTAGPALVEFFDKVIRLAGSYLTIAAELCGEDPDDLDTENMPEPEAVFKRNPDAVRAFRGCEPLTLAVMNVITRSPECRRMLRDKDIYGQMDSLLSFVPKLFYVLKVHDACSFMKLMVLAPECRKGFLVEVNDLCNNFTLMAFLEAEFSRSGLFSQMGMGDFQFPADIYEYLTGAAYPSGQGSISLHMGYTFYDGGMVWGEMPPESVPNLDSVPVIVMARGMYPRSFDVQFVLKWHAGLNPYLKIIRELSPDETEEWLGKLPG